MSQSKISRIESSRTLPTTADLELLLDLLSASPEERAAVRSSVEAIRVGLDDQRRTIWTGSAGHHFQDDLRRFDENATEIFWYESGLIPALLQTPEYARAIFRLTRERDDDAVTAAVIERVERQRILYKRQRSFTFVLSEAALRSLYVSFDFMAAQLHQIVAMSQLSNVSIGVLPLDMYTAWSRYASFQLYDRSAICCEMPSHVFVSDDPYAIERYANIFEGLRTEALWDEDARVFVRHLTLSLVQQGQNEDDQTDSVRVISLGD